MKWKVSKDAIQDPLLTGSIRKFGRCLAFSYFSACVGRDVSRKCEEGSDNDIVLGEEFEPKVGGRCKTNKVTAYNARDEDESHRIK